LVNARDLSDLYAQYSHFSSSAENLSFSEKISKRQISLQKTSFFSIILFGISLGSSVLNFNFYGMKNW